MTIAIRSRLGRLAWATCAGALLAACGGSDGERPFKVEIRRTTGGVPHVKAADLASAGYGMGYAWAEDHACTMSGRWLTTNAEVAKRFGKDGPKFAFDSRNGTLASDLYIQKLLDEGWFDKLMQDRGPTGVLPEVREMMRGYVAGYNRYLKDVNYQLSDPRCAGADWIRPITERDLYVNAMYWADMLTTLGFGGTELQAFMAARPPGAVASALHLEAAAKADVSGPKVSASNMIALGKGATRNGTGMLFSNPHWEWNTADGMVAAHVTVPGVFNVNGMTYGASPLIGIGHNDKVGWGATAAAASVTNGVRYRLQLVPGSPTSYLVDGVRHEMVPTKVTVQVRNAAGVVEPYTHTFYETIFGTVGVSASRPWTTEYAYTWKHSPLKVSGLNMWYLYAKAKTVDDIHKADRATLGVAWINTTAADSTGRTYRSNPNPLPYVTNAMFASCTVTAGPTVTSGILDGSKSTCAPVKDSTALFPETFPAASIPYIFRDDYTFNSNDSHWISNLNQPLEGYAAMFGPQRTVLSHRSRAALQIIEERIAGTDGLPGRGFTIEQFVSKLFDGREFARMWRPELVEFCNQLVGQTGAPARLGEACTAIAAWGGTYHLDDRGAVLFKRFVERNGTSPARYTVPFDPADPLGTPRGLARTDAVRDALYGAVNDLVGSGIALDASLRGYQYRQVGAERIALPGGNIFQRLNTAPFAGADGWRGVSGTSFVYWVELAATGPVGKQILLQGQSDDPTSPRHTEQTRMYSQDKYLDILYTEQQILADKNLSTTVLRDPPCPQCSN